ncbi:sigma-70 family RNA polymerase sigma factor [Magnetospira sp. QH-2]|uniref:sigma-70 family RNA polymerase sigma factor n=1 Tax=Magnetospira sp. (strain QH-2) TaxID=1288970 RepID=UPI000814102E|nr:sigma-70 family RNA polymerase sigma factor [Magnetospira sp. QH-2]
MRREMVALLPRLRRFARGLAGTPDAADDLVQAACERAIVKADQWRQGTRLDSWMYRMIQTIHIDGIRKEKVRQIHREKAAPALTGQVSAWDATEVHMTLNQVRERIMTLPEDQRAVLLLTTVEGQSYREASDTLGIPMGTVMSRLARARTALARDLLSPARPTATMEKGTFS